MINHKRFCVIIPTHGRPENIKTLATLRRCGATCRIILLVDDQDKEAGKYKEKYGDDVFIFSKEDAAKVTDAYDNFPERRAVVYARNFCHTVAEMLCYTHFLVLDDDYRSFFFRYDKQGQFFGGRVVKNIDAIFDAFCSFMDSVKNCQSIAFSQGGDFIGGSESRTGKELTLSRKCMNSFFCKTDRPFKFMGKINEDVNTYTLLGSRGQLFFTMPQVQLNQEETQKQKGGLTEIYLFLGTYVKSFYSVIGMPSSVSITSMGRKDRRIHHHVDWGSTVPKIVNEKVKKK